MANNGDYIKINRSLLCWKWFTDVNTTHLWLYILLKANWADGCFKDEVVPRGTFITTYARLSAETGLTIQQVRTGLRKLEGTGEITRKSTSKQQAITVEKYNDYQVGNGKPNKRATSEQQAINNDIRINKEEEEIKNKELYINNTTSIIGNSVPTIEEVEAYITKLGYHFSAYEFWHYYNAQGWKLSNGMKMKDWGSCCVTWEKKYREKHPSWNIEDESSKIDF